LFGGKKDLRRKVLRVLHPLSFRDDPTRIFRLARFAARGFKIEPSTKQLVSKSIKYISKVSPARVREELLAILREKKSYGALRLLKKWNILNIFLPGVNFNRDKEKIGNLKSIEAKLALLLKGFSLNAMVSILRNLKLPKKTIGEVVKLSSAKKPGPMLNGKDLIKLGYTPGPLFGAIFRKLIEKRIRTRKEAVKFVIDKFPRKL
jgi:tRNA nucleotidyltransferase/poly(A) polymerase